MRIVLFGTGFVGGALAGELADRGHEVTAVARHPDTRLTGRVTTMAGSVYDPAIVASAVKEAEVAISALAPLDDRGGLPASTAVLVGAAKAAGARLGVVGSSAILPVRPGGPRHADTPGFPAFLADRVSAQPSQPGSRLHGAQIQQVPRTRAPSAHAHEQPDNVTALDALTSEAEPSETSLR